MEATVGSVSVYFGSVLGNYVAARLHDLGNSDGDRDIGRMPGRSHVDDVMPRHDRISANLPEPSRDLFHRSFC